MEEIVRLRGHHLICLLGFRGLGYSDDFISNMAEVHTRVFSGGAMIQIVEGADDICSACPHLVNSRCENDSSSQVERKDARVIEKLGLALGSRLASKEAYRLLKSIFSPEDLTEVCGDCSWLELGYCADGLLGCSFPGRSRGAGFNQCQHRIQ